MYKQVETDKEFVTERGVKWHPVATLASKGGGRCQICVDDSCYLAFLKWDEYYVPIYYLFEELVDFLRTAPRLTNYISPISRPTKEDDFIFESSEEPHPMDGRAPVISEIEFQKLILDID